MKIELRAHVPYKYLFYLTPESIEQISGVFTGIELYLTQDFIDEAEQKTKELNTLFDSLNIRRSVHGPFLDLNPGSLDDKIRKVTGDRGMQGLRIANEIRADRYVIHTGYPPIFYMEIFGRWVENARSYFEQMLCYADKLGIGICVENTVEGPELFRKVLDSLNIPNLHFCCDVGHIFAFSKSKNLKEELKFFPPNRVLQLHLSDNNSEKDEHLALGMGTLPLNEFAAWLHEDKFLEDPLPIVIEMHTLQDLLISGKFLLKHFKEWDVELA